MMNKNGINTGILINELSSDKSYSKMSPYEFWAAIGNPKYICAPMVDQSELGFRILTKKYGTDIAYTPMIHSVIFTTQDKYREKWLNDISPLEQPSFVQFCGHDPDILLAAGKLVENKCACVDINLGCPQQIAKRGFYGSFLLENTELVLKIAGYLSNNLKCAVSCKIRLFPDLNRTVELANDLSKTGIKVLAVHGRTKEQNKNTMGTSNWDAIRMVKESIDIPLIANGGLTEFSDIDKCFEVTKCDAVMSAEKLLENPFFFSGEIHDIDDIALEYLTISRDLNTDLTFVRSHLFKFYYQAFRDEPSFNEKLVNTKNYEDYFDIAREIKEFRKDVNREDKFGWYYRYQQENQPKIATREEDLNYGQLFDQLFS